MKRLFLSIATVALFAGSAQAEVRQASVGGETGDPVYSLSVTGSNGQAYKCKPDIVTENGVRKRICLPDDDDATPLFGSGTGISAAVPAAVVALVVLAAASSGSSSSTTGTTSN